MSTHPADEEGGAIGDAPGVRRVAPGGRQPTPREPRSAPGEPRPARRGGEPGEGRPSDPGGARPGYRAGAPRSVAPPPSAAERAERHRNAAARAEQRRSAEAVVTVVWDPELRRPSSFLWRRRTFRVERVVRTWVLRSGWWSEQTEVSCHYWRVRAEGRLFDLSFDRIAKVWRLERVLN
jgi:hypothetical protein